MDSSYRKTILEIFCFWVTSFQLLFSNFNLIKTLLIFYISMVVRYSECNITRIPCNGPTGCQMVIDTNVESIYSSREVLSRLGPLIGTTSSAGFQVWLFTKNNKTVVKLIFSLKHDRESIVEPSNLQPYRILDLLLVATIFI